MQPDTIIPDLSNPQSWNRYSYVTNRPISATDPTGHVMETDTQGDGKCELKCLESLKKKDRDKHNKDQDTGTPYWDLDPSHPDYYTLTLSYAIGTVEFTIDRYGQAYWAFGGSLNTTEIGGPPGVSFMAGRIGGGLGDQPPPPVLSPKSISSFLTGVAGNGSVGAGPAGGATLSPFSEAINQFGTHSTIAFEVGASTPFVGGSVTYGLQFRNETANSLSQSFIQNIVIPLLP